MSASSLLARWDVSLRVRQSWVRQRFLNAVRKVRIVHSLLPHVGLPIAPRRPEGIRICRRRERECRDASLHAARPSRRGPHRHRAALGPGIRDPGASPSVQCMSQQENTTTESSPRCTREYTKIIDV